MTFPNKSTFFSKKKRPERTPDLCNQKELLISIYK